MKIRALLVLSFIILSIVLLQAQTKDIHYIEVTGTSEIEIVPDEIHYIIEIKEYFEEEFDGKSKPEEYRTKVPLAPIEKALRIKLDKIGIPEEAIRTQEIAGDYQRIRGRDYLISKVFDITLQDFNQINDIIKNIDTQGVNSMRIGELKNKDMQAYRRKGKIDAVQAALLKAAYLAEAMRKKLGDVIRITEPQNEAGQSPFYETWSNVRSTEADSFDTFRTIKLNYSMLVRFEILDGQTADNGAAPAQKEKKPLE